MFVLYCLRFYSNFKIDFEVAVWLVVVKRKLIILVLNWRFWAGFMRNLMSFLENPVFTFFIGFCIVFLRGVQENPFQEILMFGDEGFCFFKNIFLPERNRSENIIGCFLQSIMVPNKNFVLFLEEVIFLFCSKYSKTKPSSFLSRKSEVSTLRGKMR